jgi:hypothetical protein
MTPDELREAVARAIEDADQTLRPLPEWRLAVADAALAVVREALREPTHKMLTASYFGDNAQEMWVAMLAASPLGGPGHE